MKKSFSVKLLELRKDAEQQPPPSLFIEGSTWYSFFQGAKIYTVPKSKI